MVHGFREPGDFEKEIVYRMALADFVAAKDLIESEEIRNGVGWDKWNAGQKIAMLARQSMEAKAR